MVANFGMAHHSTSLFTPAQRILIARLNDQARRAIGLCCVCQTSPGFRALTSVSHAHIYDVIASYDAWDIANDHHSERDFGAVFLNDQNAWTSRLPDEGSIIAALWHFEYLAADGTAQSSAPWDSSMTIRNLHIMLSWES